MEMRMISGGKKMTVHHSHVVGAPPLWSGSAFKYWHQEHIWR